jgi:thioredoxin-dependent peroxiredoxin
MKAESLGKFNFKKLEPPSQYFVVATMNKGIFQSMQSFLTNDSKSSEDIKHLKVGDAAPNFTALNELGELVKLSDFHGKKLAIFFYPADNTPACTAAACSLRDNYGELKASGIEMLGVSPDSQKKHQNFIKKFGFPFPLVADENMELMKAFGVWGLKKFMGREFDGVLRTTFLIDENGVIEKIFDKVDTKNHAEQIANSLK